MSGTKKTKKSKGDEDLTVKSEPPLLSPFAEKMIAQFKGIVEVDFQEKYMQRQQESLLYRIMEESRSTQ